MNEQHEDFFLCLRHSIIIDESSRGGTDSPIKWNKWNVTNQNDSFVATISNKNIVLTYYIIPI